MSDPTFRKSANSPTTAPVPAQPAVQSHAPSGTPHLGPIAVTKASPEPDSHGEVQEGLVAGLVTEAPRTETETITQPEAPNPIAPLQIDPAAADDGQGFNQGFNDADSAVGSSTASHATTSLAESVMNYEYENGRRYHAFRKGEYLLPNDESEQDRLDLQHHIFRLTLGGKLFRAPITKNPQRVLDMGTGTGIWAIDFADEFPSAEVIGTDLSPIQPSWVPPNCKFLIDDLESNWVWSPSEAFDFIHGKGLCGSIKDWPRLYEQIYHHLKPGAWVELQEYEGVVTSDDDPKLLHAPHIDYWQQLVNKAMVQIGKNFNVAGEQKQHMIDAGFVDVRDDIYKVPSGRWPRDPKLKELGMYQLEQLVDCVEPFTWACFTRVLQWSAEETQVLMANVKRDFRNKQNHLHAKFHFVYGRKPL